MLHTILIILFALLIIGAVLVIISDIGDSGRKLAWLLVITFVPVLGLILYLIFGINYRNDAIFRRQHKRYIDIFTQNADSQLLDRLFNRTSEQDVREDFRPLVQIFDRPIVPSPSYAEDIEIFTKGQRKFELLMRDLENARESIHMEYFHFGIDAGSKAIRDMLMKKASEGVKVRFLNENIANFPIHGSYYNKMRKTGVEVRNFTDTRSGLLNLIAKLNYRNHRKIVVIDGKIGYTGGMNINDHYFKKWRDTHLRITGDAVCRLQDIFLDSWLNSKGELDRPLEDYFPISNGEKNNLVHIVPDEPDIKWPLIQMGYEWVLMHTKKYIYLQTPYFVPPEPVLDALKAAALSGADVRLMVPQKPDNFFVGLINKSYYEECLAAGVRIFERKGEFCHAKTFVCDDYLSCIGTSNMDFRSFNLAYEVNTYIYDEEIASQNKQIFLDDMPISEEINYEEWVHRPFWKRFFQHFFRLFAPLM